jgi:hypothetical protein
VEKLVEREFRDGENSVFDGPEIFDEGCLHKSHIEWGAFLKCLNLPRFMLGERLKALVAEREAGGDALEIHRRFCQKADPKFRTLDVRMIPFVVRVCRYRILLKEIR